MRSIKKSLLFVTIALMSAAGSSRQKDEVKTAVSPKPTGKPQLIVETKHAKRIRTMAFSSDGKVLAITFSPDEKRLALEGAKETVRQWDLVTGTEIRTLKNAAFAQDNKASSIAFSPNGKTQAIGREDGTIKLRDVATGTEIRTLKGHTNTVFCVNFSPDGKMLASAGGDQAVRLWDAATGEPLVSLVSFVDDSWVVATPDGRFDTDQIDEVKDLHWQVADASLKALPLEVFMRDYYEPNLLPRVLARGQFKPVRDFSKLNLTQPEVKIASITPDSSDTFQVTVEVANVKSAVQKDANGYPLESGVYDVRLFRDGQLVGYLPKEDGPVKLSVDGKALLKFSKIRWPHTGLIDQTIDFSAYAFNADGIKSATARAFTQPEKYHERVKGRTYVISVGVNAYDYERLNLRYAANDARQMQTILPARLAALNEYWGYEEVISVPLISDYELTLADGRTLAAQDATIQQVRAGRKRITENRATKAHLRAVLDRLAGRQADAAVLKEIPNADKLRPARPEDLVLISVSSHGYTDSNGIFYLVPSDSGTAPLSSPEFRSHCVSSDDLLRWLRDIDAGDLVIIVDACHSAAAVEGTDFKPGPMGSRGLGQLSYDKGMRILTATQADNVALEANQVRQGLLTYALLHEGLEGWRADYKPRDKSIMLTEWLAYGVERVPRLYEEVKAGHMEVAETAKKLTGALRIIRDTVDPREVDNYKAQQPKLFNFARRRSEVVLARQQ